MGEQERVDVREVLKSFGWLCGEEFDNRYYTDRWVFNLVNIIEHLAQERHDLKKGISYAIGHLESAETPWIAIGEAIDTLTRLREEK